MNKQEKLNFLEALKNNPRIKNVWYDPAILLPHTDDSIWYSGCVLSFTLDDRYTYECRADGDVRLTWVPDGDDVVSKGEDSARIIEFLLKHHLTTDKKVSAAENRGDLYFGNNNWWQEYLWDKETGENLMYDSDVSEGPFDVGLSYLDEWIERGRSM